MRCWTPTAAPNTSRLGGGFCCGCASNFVRTPAVATPNPPDTCLAEAGINEPIIELVGTYPSPTVLINGVDVMRAHDEAEGDVCRLDPPTHVGVVAGKVVGHDPASRSGLFVGGALACTGWCGPLRHPSHPANVGLACRPVGAWRRHLMKLVKFYGAARARPHFFGDGLAAVEASGAMYAVDNGLSDSPCQFRFRRVRIARTMEESAGLTRFLRKGAGDESEGGRLPGGQGHDYRTA